MLPKPTCHSADYATQFQDASVVAAYPKRPPYPRALFDILEELLGQPRVVLDIGCGTGDLARPLAGRVDRLDAVDVSAPMIQAGRHLPGGDDVRLNWIVGRFEDTPLAPPYGLATAAQSLHWTDWYVALPRVAELLARGAYLAVIERESQPHPWAADALGLIQRYSTNLDFVAYDLIDELAARGLFEVVGTRTTEPTPFRQTIDNYVESFHSMNGLSRARMTAEAAAGFDGGVRELLAAHGCRDWVESRVVGHAIWGHPCRRT